MLQSTFEKNFRVLLTSRHRLHCHASASHFSRSFAPHQVPKCECVLPFPSVLDSTIILECLSDLRVGACRDPRAWLVRDCGTVVYHIVAWDGCRVKRAGLEAKGITVNSHRKERHWTYNARTYVTVYIPVVFGLTGAHGPRSAAS